MPTTQTSATPAVSRVDIVRESPELVTKLRDLGFAVRKGAIEQTILDLVTIRASQINGCAFCLDMHVKEAKLHGERELRVYHLPVWRESNLFTPRERAALEWTEVLTKLPEHGVTDEIYHAVRRELSEKEISDLTFAITTINAFNRISIGFRAVPGSADAAFGLDKAGVI
ncbi:MAG TPA: carboxymuconolactone decarboxylase family protein [Bryobacteraceae bacterium]|nr:carboxymuconolactone decarboxylase family protein [Bryobacteraceae bacterium]